MKMNANLKRQSQARRSGSFMAGLMLGLLFGAVAMAQGDDANAPPLTAILYAIGALAVDTETNAESIEGLSDRIDHLESAVKVLTSP